MTSLRTKQTNQQTHRRLYCIVMPIPSHFRFWSLCITSRWNSTHITLTMQKLMPPPTNTTTSGVITAIFQVTLGGTSCSFSLSVPEQNLWGQLARYFYMPDVTQFSSVKTLKITRSTDPQWVTITLWPHCVNPPSIYQGKGALLPLCQRSHASA